jgi:simple sugar transport system ATP-binding protein
LTAENLTGKGRFADVSFSLYPGEILGITGLLGSGRNELAHALFGLHPADSGQLFVEGRKVELKTVQDALDNGIAFVPEDRLTQGLLLEQSIANNINICTIDRLTGNRGLIDQEKFDQQVNQWVEDLAIRIASPSNPVKSLSGGNQQRVVIAKWLAAKPRILILSSPTAGVDVGSKESIHLTLRKLAEAGMGIILISDDIPEVTNNCSRILLMRSGRIVDEYRGGELTEDELSDILLVS